MQDLADRGLSGQEPPRQYEQIVELQRAGDGPGERTIEHETSGDRAHHRLAVLAPRCQLGVDGDHQRELVGPQLVEGLDADHLPVGAVAAPAAASQGLLQGVEAAQRVADASGACQSIGGHGESFQQRLLAVARRHRTGEEITRLVEHGVDVRVRARRRIELHAILHEVPVGLEVLDDPPQPPVPTKGSPLAQLHQLGGAEPRSDLATSLVEELVEQVLPALVERELALQLVEHREPRRQSGLDRELEEQPPGEGVQGTDRRVVERLGGGLATGSDECGTQPVSEISRRLLGERDRGDRLDGLPLVDEGHDPLDER